MSYFQNNPYIPHFLTKEQLWSLYSSINESIFNSTFSFNGNNLIIRNIVEKILIILNNDIDLILDNNNYSITNIAFEKIDISDTPVLIFNIICPTTNTDIIYFINLSGKLLKKINNSVLFEYSAQNISTKYISKLTNTSNTSPKTDLSLFDSYINHEIGSNNEIILENINIENTNHKVLNFPKETYLLSKNTIGNILDIKNFSTYGGFSIIIEGFFGNTNNYTPCNFSITEYHSGAPSSSLLKFSPIIFDGINNYIMFTTDQHTASVNLTTGFKYTAYIQNKMIRIAFIYKYNLSTYISKYIYINGYPVYEMTNISKSGAIIPDSVINSYLKLNYFNADELNTGANARIKNIKFYNYPLSKFIHQRIL